MNEPLSRTKFTYKVNGEERTAEKPFSVEDLLTELVGQTRMVAVERNGDVIPRRLHQTTMLREDDRLEVVTIVGGG